eukprot:COSAG01_NODE_18492_length_1072_cov_1.409044_2_plen_74_part_01
MYWVCVHTVRLEHTRSLVKVGAVLSNCVVVLHTVSATQIRSLSTVGATLSYSVSAWHTVKAMHSLSTVVFGDWI